ncbi:hypothetical protein PENNAL_c0093G10949 [Penicillium nalgiovense]|uniref:Cysteine protease n=1 Tax=Penicillium nalgiovense TaxID=60175 RepID=A0A1V6XC16_PENNA|nr:hypothetical protein PENNAL_c0093G10949 [Penicillium nalgiovense]
MTMDMEKCKRIVQYFWDPEPRNDVPAASIWCLGREYAHPQPPSDPASNNPHSPSRQPNASTLNDTTWPKAFLSDFGSRIWITYRSNFTPIPRAKTPEATSSMTLGSEVPQLRVYVTNDTSDVYEDKFAHVAHDESGRIQPTLILIGTRLGIDNVTPAYWDGLRAALTYPQSVGIAGGRPSASHYFVGAQDCHLFFLDPHTTRPATLYRPDGPYTQEELDSYYTSRLRRIHIKDMDPSMLIGFLVKDEDDWADWKERIQSTPGQPIVHIFPSQRQPDHGHGRAEALDEVEALDDSDEIE